MNLLHVEKSTLTGMVAFSFLALCAFRICYTSRMGCRRWRNGHFYEAVEHLGLQGS